VTLLGGWQCHFLESKARRSLDERRCVLSALVAASDRAGRVGASARFLLHTAEPDKGGRVMSNPIATTAHPFVVVVALDLADTETSGYALDQTARIAMRVAGSQMHLVHVLANGAGADKTRDAAGCLERYMTAKAKQLGGLARQLVGVHVRSGEAGHEIARLASEVNADLIVVGTHRRHHLKQLFLGSTAEHVMATATCPVFVAGPRPTPQPSHVIVIEPPCPDCVQTRQATHGRAWWCTRHSEHHHLHHLHRYSYHSDWPFETHDSGVTSTGV
jgi:nucleotide-binding universal stress UspA family protein